jgi:hypothetical protein
MGPERVCEDRFLRNDAEWGFVSAIGDDGRGVDSVIVAVEASRKMC